MPTRPPSPPTKRRCWKGCDATTCSWSCTSSSPPTRSITPISSCPPTSQLEHVDIHGSYGHLDVMYNPPAIAPPGECRSNNDVFRALARRLGFEPDLFPDDETLIGELLDGGPTLRGITLDRLKAEGPVRLNIPEAFAPFADGLFPTPSGKCEALLRADEGRRTRPLADVHAALEDR